MSTQGAGTLTWPLTGGRGAPACPTHGMFIGLVPGPMAGGVGGSGGSGTFLVGAVDHCRSPGESGECGENGDEDGRQDHRRPSFSLTALCNLNVHEFPLLRADPAFPQLLSMFGPMSRAWT